MWRQWRRWSALQRAKDSHECPAFPFSAEPPRLVTASETGVAGLSTEDMGCSNNALHGCSEHSAIQQTREKHRGRVTRASNR